MEGEETTESEGDSEWSPEPYKLVVPRPYGGGRCGRDRYGEGRLPVWTTSTETVGNGTGLRLNLLGGIPLGGRRGERTEE